MELPTVVQLLDHNSDKENAQPVQNRYRVMEKWIVVWSNCWIEENGTTVNLLNVFSEAFKVPDPVPPGEQG